jgi:hypothetical protein
MKIKLRFSADDGWISRIIRFFTWSKFSHVDYVFTDGSLFSAHPCGVSFKDRNPNEIEEYFEMEVTDKKVIEKFLFQQINRPYDWKAIFGMPLRRNWQEEDNWFCSELIAAAIQCDTKLFNEDISRITPRDLYINPLLKKVE